ncbi:MAG: MBL fold metallo-hydrolase [Lacunisphaera sp.]
MSRNIPPGIHTIRGIMGVCHLLVDEFGDAVLLDTGLVGEPMQLKFLLWRLGLKPASIKAILLTHGHLDHAGNLFWAQRFSGAPIYAHATEQAHLDGAFRFVGAARWCGRLERIGYDVLNYRPARINRFIADGDRLPFWGGLEVIHLPGHTEGHCGFYSARHDVLFSGDLFASYFFNVHLPPAILNSKPELIRGSLRKALSIGAKYVVPQHYDVLDGELHGRRFRALCRRELGASVEQGRC